MESATPPSSYSSSVKTTYLKIGASICCGSFTKHLHLGMCMIIDAQNCLSWSNTPQSRYNIRALCGGRHFHKPLEREGFLYHVMFPSISRVLSLVVRSCC